MNVLVNRSSTCCAPILRALYLWSCLSPRSELTQHFISSFKLLLYSLRFSFAGDMNLSLPSNGEVKRFNENKVSFVLCSASISKKFHQCPLDGFEMLLFAPSKIPNRHESAPLSYSFPFCPLCYNQVGFFNGVVLFLWCIYTILICSPLSKTSGLLSL